MYAIIYKNFYLANLALMLVWKWIQLRSFLGISCLQKQFKIEQSGQIISFDCSADITIIKIEDFKVCFRY